jgi:hypothetical protein
MTSLAQKGTSKTTAQLSFFGSSLLIPHAPPAVTAPIPAHSARAPGRGGSAWLPANTAGGCGATRDARSVDGSTSGPDGVAIVVYRCCNKFLACCNRRLHDAIVSRLCCKSLCTCCIRVLHMLGVFHANVSKLDPNFFMLQTLIFDVVDVESRCCRHVLLHVANIKF